MNAPTAEPSAGPIESPLERGASDAPRPRRRRRWIVRSLQVLMGLTAGLLIAELGFRWRDHGAFPHLNVYRPDPVLGVRLEPGATEDLSFGGNPVTHVRINADGYRGAALPPAASSKDEVLVVGDSQVFGLGVEEDQTFSARLAAQLGGTRAVINAGVPTYGPAEYRQVVAEMLDRRHIGTVVFTVNMVNDLFETAHPNLQRHAVWDGWAVRVESAPDSVLTFPGRHFLFTHSHLIFALRRWWYHRGPSIGDRGFASEGTWTDLVGEARDQSARHQEQVKRRAQAREERHRDLQEARTQLDSARAQLDDALTGYERQHEPYDPHRDLVFRAARANPGDILEEDDPQAEGGRAVVITADLIRQGARYRARIEAKLLAEARKRRQQKILDAFESRTTLEQKLRALDAAADLDVPRVTSPLAPILGDVARLCRAHHARLVVLVLPIDVQVSPAEWNKYGAAPRDMTRTRVLIDDVLSDARAAGATALDATPALAAAEPGAFLDKDIHMTPRGHRAVAELLARTLTAPDRAAPPASAAASGPALSNVPIPSSYDAAREVNVKGSTAAGCETKRVREWLRVSCRKTGVYGEGMVPLGVDVTAGGHGKAMTLTVPGAATLVAPVLEGDELSATFTWNTQTEVLRVSWPRGAAGPTMGFDPPVMGKHPVPRRPSGASMIGRGWQTVPEAVCHCWTAQYHQSCNGAYGATDDACLDRYRGDCARFLECVRRDPASPPGGA